MVQTLLVPVFNSPKLLDLDLLGLSFRERINKQARKFGIPAIIFFTKTGPVPNLSEKFLIYFPDTLFSPDALKTLLSAQIHREAYSAFEHLDSLALVHAKNPEEVLELLRHSDAPSHFVSRLGQKFKPHKLPLGRKHWIKIESERQRKACENWLLRGLIKDTEGFMSRHFERKISLTLTRALVRTPLSPNVMTVVSSLIGLAGAFFFLTPEKWYHFTGALLFWLHSVLDGCDGEIARLKFLESRFGGLLDFWGDNLVHSAVFAAIAYGSYVRYGTDYSLIAGALAVGGTVLSAGFVYWKTMRPKKESGPLFTSVAANGVPQTPVQKVADFLARRDFIYLVIALAYFDKTQWFLWAGAVGSPIYFLVLVGLNLKKKKSSKI